MHGQRKANERDITYHGTTTHYNPIRYLTSNKKNGMHDAGDSGRTLNRQRDLGSVSINQISGINLSYRPRFNEDRALHVESKIQIDPCWVPVKGSIQRDLSALHEICAKLECNQAIKID